jgi:hypothetical protein
MPNGGVREDPAYEMTYDGFNLIAMSFTTKKALFYKIEFINEFNRRGDELQRRGIPINDTAAMYRMAADEIDRQKARADAAEAALVKVEEVVKVAEGNPIEWTEERSISAAEATREFPALVASMKKWRSKDRKYQKWLSTHIPTPNWDIVSMCSYLKTVHGLVTLKQVVNPQFDRHIFNRVDVESAAEKVKETE